MASIRAFLAQPPPIRDQQHIPAEGQRASEAGGSVASTPIHTRPPPVTNDRAYAGLSLADAHRRAVMCF